MDSSQIPEKLHKRWQELFPDTEATIVERIWTDVYIHYTEPSRYYHTLSHIHDMFILMDGFEGSVSRPFVVSCSVFYHDIIYSPGSNQNEEKSAYVAGTALSRLNIAPDKINLICSYILATKDHFSTQTNDTDLKYFLDFDLSILSRPRTEYENYARQVRKEYSILPGEQYKAGRIFFLKKILRLPHLYFTEDFRLHEEQAKQNIEWEINMLQHA